jgi:L-ribulose-5-phosphate 4-epimerase
MRAADYLALRQTVAEANRAIADEGLVVLSFGNVSGVDREAAVLAIKPSGVPCGATEADDVVVVSLGGGEVVWGEGRPSSDTPTHRVLYNTFGAIGGIVHTHSLYASSWAQAQRPIPCLGTTHADHFRGEVPVTRSMKPEEIGDEYETNTGLVIVELFETAGVEPETTPGVLVASHGPFIWASDPAGAVENAIAVELMAQMAIQTLAINPGQVPISDSLLDRHFSRKHGPLAYYGQR